MPNSTVGTECLIISRNLETAKEQEKTVKVSESCDKLGKEKGVVIKFYQMHYGIFITHYTQFISFCFYVKNISY